MTKHDPVKFNTEWHRKHDESKLMLWVAVSQVHGTRGILEEVQHYARPDEEKIRWGHYHSESIDPSSEAKWEVAERLLVLHANRLMRAIELGVDPF